MSSSNHPTRPTRALVADDQRDVLEALHLLLRPEGFEVEAVGFVPLGLSSTADADVVAMRMAAPYGGLEVGEPAVPDAMARALELLDLVQIPSAKSRLKNYPFEMSGGMRQRAMIALALSCRPSVLLADEPTTALDATVQIQILLLLRELQREMGLAVIFVTHDIGAALEVADRIAVMYAGRIVEVGSARALIREPRHPYTLGLFRSLPDLEAKQTERLAVIPGMVPSATAFPSGCRFRNRCTFATDACGEDLPALVSVGAGHDAACIHLERVAESTAAG